MHYTFRKPIIKRGMLMKWIKALGVLGCICLVFITGCATCPETESDSGFPTGTFVSATDDGIRLRFRKDGTGYRQWDAAEGWVDYKNFIYAVHGNLYTEMTHSGELKVPATYYWNYDGEVLSFTRWGKDPISTRRETYEDHTYVRKPPESS